MKLPWMLSKIAPRDWVRRAAPVLALVLAASTFLASCSETRRRRDTTRFQEAGPVERNLDFERTTLDDVDDGGLALADERDSLAPFAADGAGARGADNGVLLAQATSGEENPAPDRSAASGGRQRSPAEVLEDLETRGRLELLEARYQRQLGDQAYEAGDFAKAIEHYRRALELNPALPGVRDRYSVALQAIGERSGDVEAVERTLVERRQARAAERLYDARRGIEEAEELLAEGEFETAGKNLNRIREELKLIDDYPEDIRPEIEKIDNLLADISARRLEWKQQQEIEAQARARAEAENLREELEQAKARQVRELVSKAADYIRFNEYEKAIDACERILKLEPDHRIARFWLEDSKEQLVDRRELNFIRLDLENRALSEEDFTEASIPYADVFTFPDDSKWAEIQERSRQLEVIEADDPEPVRRIKNLLETTEVDFEIIDKPLTDAVEFLRQRLGINIDIDVAVPAEDININITVRKMKALNALKQILKQADLAYTFRESVLFITEKDKARGELHFQIYNVADILNKIRDFQGPVLRLRSADEQEGESAGVSFDTFDELEDTTLQPEDLIDLVKESTGAEEVWGELNQIDFDRGLLFVTAPIEVHRQLRTVLQNLRKDSDIFVMIEARFIDITDDFLQDIGVDYRSLGAVSNLGTPFGNIIHDSSTGGNDLGFVKQGNPDKDVTLVKGQDRWAGRVQNIIDGFTGVITGDRLRGGNQGIGGLTLQSTWLDPFQLNAILRAVQEKSDVRELTAPTITAHNGQRVFVSVITQRAYIADYELVSGGTGFSIIEVADPVVATFQEGVILDVDPVISPDKKFITLDVRPTMATLIGGVISTILISLGSFTSVAFEVPIGIPQVSLQQSFTSVTVPNGGTVLLGGFKSLSEAKYVSSLPFLGQIPIVKNLFRRKAEISEKRSLVILITARIINPRGEEASQFNEE